MCHENAGHFATGEYCCFGPQNLSVLLGWRLVSESYAPIAPDERGWLWSQTLDLWPGLWEGVYFRDHTRWLRLYTPEGELVLTKDEAAERKAAAAESKAAGAEHAARLAAEAELERLRAEAEEKNRRL